MPELSTKEILEVSSKCINDKCYFQCPYYQSEGVHSTKDCEYKCLTDLHDRLKVYYEEYGELSDD